jgi:hypothetical protein
MAGAVYVYGVLPAEEQRQVSEKGVEGAEVRTVEHAGVAALVSPVRGSALVAAREVRAHWTVLGEAVKRATILPVRFGTVLESDDAVRERLLGANAERLSALLRDVAGCVQLTVKGEYVEDRLMRDVVRGSPAIAALRERLEGVPDQAGYYERIRLGELVADEVARRREDDTRHALERLEPLAVAARAEQATQPNAAFNLAFLVRRDRESAFTKGVSELGEDLEGRIEIRYVGPLPPYSFADADMSAEAASWA